MSDFLPGQRWFSSAEPELGLGTVLRVLGRQVQLVFAGSDTLRLYAIGNAPLLRAAFRPGDRIQVSGTAKVVAHIEQCDGLMRYHCADCSFSEGELDAEQPVSQADARLLAGRVDRNDRFELRRETLERRALARSHAGWGVLGARINLIEHQLRVAEIAAERRPPRLLLADEVGLGKTIEACLVIAQALASGRASRVLILVPESLVNQWFVELLRRFNLAFAIYDEERCEALEMSDIGVRRNPFDDEQCIITSVDWLASHSKRAEQALATSWDILLVDEAHHLAWTPESASPAYQLVESLARQTPGLLLLSATPEQPGLGGHFARLRLLDPARHADLDAFSAEQRGYLALSALAERLLAGDALTTGDMETLAPLFPDASDDLAARLGRIASGDIAARDSLLTDLIDRHGTGRVMIRHRRVAVGGFPRRVAHVAQLAGNDDEFLPARLHAEFEHDLGDAVDEPAHDYRRDPRTDWLLDTLAAIAPAKALLLCRTRAKVQALEEALRERSHHELSIARFHEDMNLLQRDRNAAHFADPDGARLLIASEIGAEGRNFQFAQHLIFWDMPFHPDMLEQRIGRLDRIGQTGDVHLHASAIVGSAQEVLLRWMHEGLGALEHVVADGRSLLRQFGSELLQVVELDSDAREPGMTALIDRSQRVHAELADVVARGRDWLLERVHQRPLAGPDEPSLLNLLHDDDAAQIHDDYALRLLESFGVHAEAVGATLWLLDPEYQSIEGFEELKAGPRAASFDRDTALARDDLLYLRADHPMLLSAQEMLLSSESGNATFLTDDSLPPRGAVLEAVFVLESIAPAALNLERFLPALPLTVAIDMRLQLRPEFTPSERSRLRAGDRQYDLTSQRKILANLIPPMLARAHEEGAARCADYTAAAAMKASAALDSAILRLEALARVNCAVRPEEIQALYHERTQLLIAINNARPRLDALRLIANPEFLSLRR